MTRHALHMDLRPDLRLVLAPNPSAMTERGTNTWIVGRGAVAVIDPGPAEAAHLAAILAALGPTERVSHILVTHAHADHSALAPALSRHTGAPVLAFGTARDGMSAAMAALAAEGLGAASDARLFLGKAAGQAARRVGQTSFEGFLGLWPARPMI